MKSTTPGDARQGSSQFSEREGTITRMQTIICACKTRPQFIPTPTYFQQRCPRHDGNSFAAELDSPSPHVGGKDFRYIFYPSDGYWIRKRSLNVSVNSLWNRSQTSAKGFPECKLTQSEHISKSDLLKIGQATRTNRKSLRPKS